MQPKVRFSEYKFSCEASVKLGLILLVYTVQYYNVIAVTFRPESLYKWRAMHSDELCVKLTAGPAVGVNKSESPSESEGE